MNVFKRGGYTLVELAIAAAVLAILIAGFSKPAFQVLRGVSLSIRDATGLTNVQGASAFMEKEMEEMTLVTAATANSIEFRLNSDRLPGYSPDAVNSTGVPNGLNPDWDGDTLGMALPQWNNGNNLVDEDDDNNGCIDLQVRYDVTSDGDLVRDAIYNDCGAWGRNVNVLAKRIRVPIFTYFGSINGLPGGTGADLNSDGIITQEEIDKQPGCNNNGKLDLPQEYLFIHSIQVDLAQGAATPLSWRVRPPLLPVNRRIS